MAYEAQLREAIEREKSKKVIDLIRAVLSAGGAEGVGEGEGDSGTAGISAEDYVKECHRGGKKRGLAWISETADVPMPVVHKKATVQGENGEEIEGELDAYKSGFREGKTVPVLYLPDDPQTFTYEKNGLLLPLIFGGAGVFLLAVGICGFFRRDRRPDDGTDYRDGSPDEAERGGG